MADSKTEKATPKRRKDERKKGNVFQSKDVVSAASILLIFFTLKLIFPFIYDYLSKFIYNLIIDIKYIETLTISSSVHIFTESLIALILTAGPVMLVAMAIGIITSGIQTKFIFSYENMKMKFSRLSPIKGIKNLLSVRSVVELIKSLLKVSIIGYVLYGGVKGIVNDAMQLMYIDISEAVAFILNSIMDIVIKVGGVFLCIAAADYLYQWWEYEKNIKMTKQEIKEEYKQIEGDPQVKSKIKEVQRKMAMGRMMQQVPKADVVVRNPTHFAVALKYIQGKSSAPIVIAKGQDDVALRIIAKAEEHSVPITENRPLARALYENVEIGYEIPPDYYSAIAEILAWVYSLKKEKFNE